MKYNKHVLSVFVLMGLVLPSLVLADNSARGIKAGNNFCGTLDSYLVGSEKRFGEQDAKYDSNFANRQAKSLKNRDDKDKKVADNRANVLARKDNTFKRMLGKAVTTEQKQAVTEFQTAVQNAINTRQTAVDAARLVYRTGVDKIVTDRKVVVDNALIKMKTAIEALVAKAKVDCADVAILDKTVVRTTFKNAIKTVREEYKVSLKNLAKIGDVNKPLLEARNVAFEKAHNDFKLALEAAKTTLQTKLGVETTVKN